MTNPRSISAVAAIAAAAALGVAGVAGGAPTATASKTPVKKIGVKDNFFSPKAITVKRKTKFVWKWSSANSDTHDVRLYKAPKGVKKFNSDPAATDFSVSRTYSKKGTYRYVCTFHESDNMKGKIVVK